MGIRRLGAGENELILLAQRSQVVVDAVACPHCLTQKHTLTFVHGLCQIEKTKDNISRSHPKETRTKSNSTCVYRQVFLVALPR